MIQYINIQRYDNLDFDKYLELPGYSHSFLKSEINGYTPEFKETDKVVLGKMVDAILCETGEVNMMHWLYPIAKSIAFELKEKFSVFIKRFEKQVSYTADMMFGGFHMASKVRLDFLLPGFASIDLKVTHERDVKAVIEFMGYKNQLWHQCRMAEVPKQYIMIYSVPLKKSFLINLGPLQASNSFWENKILKFGRIAA